MAKKLLPWLLVIIAVGMILYFDLQSPERTIQQTQAVQRQMVKTTLRINKDAVNSEWILNKQIIRRAAHVIEYFFLSLAACCSIYFFNRNNTQVRFGLWFPLIVCSTVALADETLKIFLPTREFGALDLVFDAVGFLIGIGIVWLVRKVKKRSS